MLCLLKDMLNHWKMVAAQQGGCYLVGWVVKHQRAYGIYAQPNVRLAFCMKLSFPAVARSLLY